MAASATTAPTVTATPTATATPAPPTATAGPTATPILSAEAFAGVWKCCTGYEVHTADGSYNFQHTLFRLLTTGLYGKMTIAGDVLTVIESSGDCTSD
ncbi:MAG: hypothetical protein ABI847_04445, partial [Anaerolineales bacterium]